MILYFSRISLSTLFLISILPLFFMYAMPNIWPVVNIIVFTFFFIWTYSIVKILLVKNKYDSTINFKSFSVLLCITNIYLILLSIYFSLTYSNIEDPKWMLPIIIIAQFFLASSSVYLVTFFAKAIATVELKRKCHFSDYLGNIVLIVFFPLGIWWLHPKIQTLVDL